MTITLCLWSSAGPARICLMRDGDILSTADAATDGPPDPSRDPTLETMVRQALIDANLTASDIDRIAVDIGPGRLSAVRGVASFANGLAFGLGAPMLPVVSAAAAAFAADAMHGLPVVVVHKAAGRTAYASCYKQGQCTIRHGKFPEALQQAASDLNALALVGLSPEEAAPILPGVRIVEAGDANLPPEDFVRFIAGCGDQFRKGPVIPITEQSEIIHAV